MNRNTELFSTNPTHLDLPRSKFNRNSGVKTSFNVGEAIVFYHDEVLPGDTFQIKTNKVVRMQPMVTAPMDNLVCDTYYFFVPNRLVWNHWKEFMGENTESAWIPETEYTEPQIEAPDGGWNIGTLADYFGIPTGVSGLSVSALPFRAYSLIIDEWFRDQNVQLPINIPKDETTVTGVNTDDYVTDMVLGGKPFVANKMHDYFTSCLPSPQRGPSVSISLGNISQSAPVVTKDETYSTTGLPTMTIHTDNGTWPSAGSYRPAVFGSSSDMEDAYIRVGAGDASASSGFNDLHFNNLYANFDVGDINLITINQLRMAFQVQKFYEASARGGARYRETLRAHFGVTSPDARMQIPEYLGGNRVPININSVIQQSATQEGTTPLGNVAGMSLTADAHGDFIKSFTEHGRIIGICVVRYDHTYQQGIPKAFLRKTKFDYYWPVFANIGEQAVTNNQLYATGTSTDEEVFGYQEAWADYRYKPSMVTGEMRSSAPASLDVWHFADDYESLPYLSAEWMQEDKSNVDRVLAVTSSVSNQLFADFYIECEATRVMPMRSIPGLIDHH